MKPWRAIGLVVLVIAFIIGWLYAITLVMGGAPS